MTVDTHDEFLYQLREPPRPEFAAALKARISQEPRRSPTARRVRTGLVVLLAALVIAACAAPQTRTPIRRAIETIKVFVLEWDDLPIQSFYRAGGQDRIEVVSPSGERKVVV
ncbi:MAG: hypothetical protein ACK8QZ_09865, partial [Anaerolineales bacterium]